MPKFSVLSFVSIVVPSRVVPATHKTTHTHFVTISNHTGTFVSDSFARKTITSTHDFVYFFLSKIMVHNPFMDMTVFRWRYYSKVTDSIVQLISIYMMNMFVWTKFSSQVLFHNISMLLYSFAVNVNSDISIFSNCWLVPLRQIKRLKSLPSSFMHNTTNYGFSANCWSIAIFDRTLCVDFSSLHVLNLLQKGIYCQ